MGKKVLPSLIWALISCGRYRLVLPGTNGFGNASETALFIGKDAVSLVRSGTQHWI